MFVQKRLSLVIVMICCFAAMVSAQRNVGATEIVRPKSYRPPLIERADSLQNTLESALAGAMRANADFKADEVAATLIDVNDRGSLKIASVRGNERIYPASVVKLFYLAALQRQIEDGKVRVSPELIRGRLDMIVDSSNEAAQYILDVLTETSSGAEMPHKEFLLWQHKRNRVNRFFTSLGYTNINVNQKTFCEDAYGIEQQSRNYAGENRNMLTTDATARLMAEIVLGNIANSSSTNEMMTLLKREPFAPTDDDDTDQAHGFIARALIDANMRDARIWSKAGWTSTARHDAAYIETASGLKFVLVIYTENHANQREFIPAVARGVIEKLESK